MNFGFIDIPYSALEDYKKDAVKKKRVCKIIPRGQFSLGASGIKYNGLICHPLDMGGNATGIGAETCRNCKLKKK